MKALLTGGAGYIGSHTAVALLNAGHDVVVVDNYSNSSPKSIRRVAKICGKELGVNYRDCRDDNEAIIRAYQADVADKDTMLRIFQLEQPDCVIHFAGLKAVGESVDKPV